MWVIAFHREAKLKLKGSGKMAYTALYRKFRPLTFGEIVGQEHITKTLKNQLILSAGEFHDNLTAEDAVLEQTLIKPAINLVLLREKAKETVASADILLTEGRYFDCASRCYYAMMFSLKTL